VTPIFAALGAFLAGLERMSRRFVVAAAVSFAGVVLVALGAGGALDLDPLGVVLAVATAATWATYSIAITPLMRRYSPYRISALVLLAGCVPLVAVALPQIVSQDYGEPTGRAWLAFGFAIVGPLVLTNVLWFRSVARVGPSRATLFANIQPFIAAVIAVVVLSERMSAAQIAGGVAIAAGILLARRRQRVQPIPE
jgi:drug/metabolite transporter (DMT)-like permease